MNLVKSNFVVIVQLFSQKWILSTGTSTTTGTSDENIFDNFRMKKMLARINQQSANKPAIKTSMIARII